jgi:hypothetical protein
LGFKLAWLVEAHKGRHEGNCIVSWRAGLTVTPSKFASDPGLGLSRLSPHCQHPPDKDTEFYAPWFSINGKPVNHAYDAPEPSPEVKALAGKGYPELEQKSGLLVFTGTNYQTGLAKQPSRSFFAQFWLP